MASIEEVFEELNFPSAPRLKRVLKQRGIAFTAGEVDRLVQGGTTRQVQAPRYKFDGKIAAADLNSRWFADLIGFLLLRRRTRAKTLDCDPLQVAKSISWLYKKCSAAFCTQKRFQTSVQRLQLQDFGKS